MADPKADPKVKTSFFLPSDALRPYVSMIYSTLVEAPRDARVEDYLHPEWANLRFFLGKPAISAIGSDTPTESPRFVVTGVTSRGTFVSLGAGRSWGIGIMPAGWAKFFRAPAVEFADRRVDGMTHPAFAAMAPLFAKLYESHDVEAAARDIDSHFAAMLADAPPDDPAIPAILSALLDEENRNVGDLTAHFGMSERSIERLCRRAFGHPPKLLLRRQRFLRSLGPFLLDPRMTWVDTMDYQYFDQAQFTRDFRHFMGMTPRAYAARPKPILSSAAVGRASIAGAPMQALHKPHA